MRASVLSNGVVLACVLSFSVFPISTANAATIFGVYAGGGVWSQGVEGSAVSEAEGSVASLVGGNANRVDLEDDLGFGTKRNFYIYGGIEHPVPLLPNVRIDYSEISQSAMGQLDRSLSFNGQTFDFSTNLLSEVDLEQTDLVFYYELLDNVVSVDIGLGVRHVEGFVEVADDAGFTSAEFSGAIPLAYLGARVDLPLTGVWAGAQARGLTYKGESLVDFDARIGWESKLGLGVEVGYRYMNLEIDEFDDIDSADLTIDGPFAGLTFSF